MTTVIQMLINGILLGSVYALLGVGMTMIFGIVKLTNLAHGEFIIIGAFGSTLLAQALGVDPAHPGYHRPHDVHCGRSAPDGAH